MEDNGDQGKQVGIMEMGWTSDPRPNSPYQWHAVTEDEKAEYLVRALQFAKQNWNPWIGLMTIIYIDGLDGQRRAILLVGDQPGRHGAPGLQLPQGPPK